MSDARYLIIHKDHPLDVRGVNSGAEMATLCLARYLVKAGQRVTVCAQLKGTGETSDHGVEFWDLGAGYDVSAMLQRAHDQGDYHLISSGRALPLLQSRTDRHCISRVLISHDRAGNDTGIRPAVLCQVADRIICVSEAQRQVFINAGAPAEKAVTIHNGVDLDVFGAGDPEQRNYRKLVFVGALVRDKGLELLIPAFAELKRKYADLSLDIYGSADLWGREKFFDEKQVERDVPGIKFHGSVPQTVLVGAYKSAGITVVPSIWFDPFPLTAIEAQVCGCPAVVTDVGGLREGVINGETGVVVEEISQAALTKALDDLLAQPARLKEMSKRALVTARGYFNWSRVAQSVIGVAEQAAATRSFAGPQAVRKRLGVISTWNQECGLATYAKFLFSRMPEGSYEIFSEQAQSSHDEPFVTRCWRRGVPDYNALYDAVRRAQIGLLHINAPHRFFIYPAFSEFLERVKADGIKVVCTIHSAFTVDPQLQRFASAMDAVFVHSPEVRLEIVANGAHPDNVKVVPHGVELRPAITPQEQQQLRTELGIPLNEKVIVAFGFMQPHKGMEAVIEAVAQLSAKGTASRGYILGSVHAPDPNSSGYLSRLKQFAAQCGVAAAVQFVDRFLPEEEIARYLRAADLVFMNYQSQYFEASGASALALGAGTVVAASVAPALMGFGDAVWHLTSGFPPGLAAETLLSNPQLCAAIRENAAHYCRERSWPVVARQLQEHYGMLGFEAAARPSAIVIERSGKGEAMERSGPRGLRVLMQNRSTTFTQRGGDTVVIEKLKAALEHRGVSVTVDVEGRQNPADFDVVHLFNFVLPEMVKAFAERAVAAGVPYVVTTHL